MLQEHVGSQDQTAAAHGGLNLIHFQKDGSIRLDPLTLPSERKQDFNDHLMLFFTGFSRISSDIAKAHVVNMSKNASDLHKMRAMVDEAVAILCSRDDIRDLGDLLHQGWIYKRNMSNQVSNSSIDSMYERARASGALGGKLLGAGGGGFMLLFVAPSNQASVMAELSDLIYVPFKFETSGSQVIYYQP